MKIILPMLKVLMCTSLLAACSVLPTQAPLSAVYDLGPSHGDNSVPPYPFLVRVYSVTEPGWLSGTRIHYRLLYDDPQRLRSYADSRWAGTPGELIQHGVEHALGNARALQKNPSDFYGIDIHVQEFEQQFASPTSATVVLQVRVVLKRYPDREPIAEHLFSYRGKSALNAQGAADAMSGLEHEFTTSLLSWIQASSAGM